MQLDLELYRERVEVEPGVVISIIDVIPDRRKQTLVLIHGFGGNALQWQYQIEAFAQENRVVALDLRGHGQSSRPAAGYEMDRIIADITTVLDQRAIHERIILVGHSFGVAIVTEFACAYPERLSHLVLIAGAGEYKLRKSYRFGFRLPSWFLRLIQPLVRNAIDFDASLQALKRFYRYNLRDWQGWQLFPQLAMPVLLILGNRDDVLPREAFERVAELIPPQNSEIIQVGVSSHMVMLERRDAVNRAVTRFIALPLRSTDDASWRNRFKVGARGNLVRERPWLARYAEGVPPTIPVPKQPLTRILERAARRFPRHTAIVFNGSHITYSALWESACRMANGLLEAGLEPGDRVMLLLPNTPQLIIAYFGALLAGGIVVPGNHLAEEAEIARQAKLTGPRQLVTLARHTGLAAAVARESPLKQVILAGENDYRPWWRRLAGAAERPGAEAILPPPANSVNWLDFLDQQSKQPPSIAVDAGQTAVIQFTSGSTGRPRGAMLSHYNLLANVMQIRAWLTAAVDGRETTMAVTPFSHAYGMTAAMNVPISQAARLVVLQEFDPRLTLRAIRRHRPSYFPGVPAMFLAINQYPKVRRYDMRSIEVCLSSAAPLPVEVEESFEKLTRGSLVECYGLSEAGPLTHAAPLEGSDKVGSVGVPLPSTEARIVEMGSGRPLAPGQIGELLVRGPQVMSGYWADEEASREAIDAHGWLHTGDIGRMDEDGYFQIVSRRQDIWKDVDEEDVFPRAIEEVIYELPQVMEVVVAVVAGQPVAFVKRQKGSTLDGRTVIAYCERRMPPTHVPRRVLFVGDFQRNLVGRVVRRDLVSHYEAQIAAEAGAIGAYLPELRQVPQTPIVE